MGKITRIVIKALRAQKNWSSHRFLKEFPSKAWCRQSLDRLIKKIDAGLPVDGFIGRSRRRSLKLSVTVCVSRVDPKWRHLACSVYYDKICLKFASHHFLLYVVYMCQKSLNCIYAFKCYHQKNWCWIACRWIHWSQSSQEFKVVCNCMRQSCWS